MHVVLERIYPFALSCGAAAAWAWFGEAPAGGIRDLFATAVSLSAIVVGFLATAMSIVLAAPDSRIMRQLRRSNYVDDLARYLQEPFLVGLALTAVAMAGYFASAEFTTSFGYVGSLVLLTTWLIAGLFRIAMVFMAYLKAAAVDDPSSVTPR